MEGTNTTKVQESKPQREKTIKSKVRRIPKIESKDKPISELHDELRKHSDARKLSLVAILVPMILPNRLSLVCVLVESKDVIFHVNPAHSLIYTFSIPGNGTLKAMDFGTIESNIIHVFQYVAQENKFDSYSPTIQTMIDSFKAAK
jgi:hypothetical protein